MRLTLKGAVAISLGTLVALGIYSLRLDNRVLVIVSAPFLAGLIGAWAFSGYLRRALAGMLTALLPVALILSYYGALSSEATWKLLKLGAIAYLPLLFALVIGGIAGITAEALIRVIRHRELPK